VTAIYGYARVSGKSQDLAAQLVELKAAGCERIYREKISAETAERPDHGSRITAALLNPLMGRRPLASETLAARRGGGNSSRKPQKTNHRAGKWRRPRSVRPAPPPPRVAPLESMTRFDGNACGVLPAKAGIQTWRPTRPFPAGFPLSRE
jgi:hypothetical protein